MKKGRWTVDQLGTVGRRAGASYFAHPSTLEGIAVRVEGESAADVVKVANAIERLTERHMALSAVIQKTRRVAR